MWSSSLSLVLQIVAFFSGSSAISILESQQPGPRVALGYATYEGITLANGVGQFLGMRYAAPPLGENRFRRPRDPLEETGIVPAKEVKRMISIHLF
jgi:acetylcholinesterase